MKKLFLIFIVILITSCLNTQHPPSTQIPIFVEPTKATTIYTEPTTQASSNPVLSSNYELPEWLKNSTTNIATAFLSNEFQDKHEVAFFNAETGEKYTIELPQNIEGYFWYDNTNFGLLTNDLKTSFRLNLTNGKLSEENISPQTVRLLEPDWLGWLNGLNVVKESSANKDFTLIASWLGEHSKDATFTAEKKHDWDGIHIINNLTNETILDITTPTGSYITAYEWSPTQNHILAYVQGKYAYPTDFISKDMTLNIIDVESGKTLSTYSGDFGHLSWSPDGEKILFQDAKSRYGNYGVGFTEAPCIIFLNLNETKCLRSIPRLVPEGHTLATTGKYSWSSDNMKIYFTYVYYPSETPPWVKGELCIYSLVDSHINCPTKNMEEMIGHGVSYSFSPSEEYIYLCISESTILNDYAGDSTDGIIKSDGTGFFSWTSKILDNSPSTLCAGSDLLWRPLP